MCNEDECELLLIAGDYEVFFPPASPDPLKTAVMTLAADYRAAGLSPLQALVEAWQDDELEGDEDDGT